MTDNKYLEEAKRFKASHEQARQFEIDKISAAQRAAVDALEVAEAACVRAREEIDRCNAAIFELCPEATTAQLGVPSAPNHEVTIVYQKAVMTAEVLEPFERTQRPIESRETKVVEGPLPKEVPLTPAEEKRQTEAFINLVRKALQVNGGSVRSYLIHEVTALVDDLAEGSFIVTHDSVRAVLGVLHARKIVRWVKNDRVMLARKR